MPHPTTTAVHSPERLFDLTGRVALVTGGASGLGARMAAALAAAGARVALADRNADRAAEVARSLSTGGGAGGAGGEAMALPMDVTDPHGVRRGVDRVVQRFGRLDVAVNAAGVAGGPEGEDDPVAVWRHVIDVDLSGVYYCCLACAEPMRRAGGGSIVNIASMSANIVNNFPQPPVDEARVAALPAYCAAKAGVKQLTRALAARWAPAIRVNCISPGYMATEMTRGIFEMPEVVAAINGATPLRRVGRPEDLDGLVVYLASPASTFVTGAEMLIDGGYSVW